MPTWQGQSLDKLSDDELLNAIHSVVTIDKNRLDKLDQVKERHAKLFAAHPPTENPTFTELATGLNDEFKKRQVKETKNA